MLLLFSFVICTCMFDHESMEMRMYARKDKSIASRAVGPVHGRESRGVRAASGGRCEDERAGRADGGASAGGAAGAPAAHRAGREPRGVGASRFTAHRCSLAR